LINLSINNDFIEVRHKVHKERLKLKASQQLDRTYNRHTRVDFLFTTIIVVIITITILIIILIIIH